MGSTKRARDNRRQPWSGAPDSVRCTRGLQSKLCTFGNFQRRFAIIHRTCPVLQRRATLNSPALDSRSAIIHRTCPVHTGLSGELVEQRLLRANGRLQRTKCAPARRGAGHARVAHRIVYRTCPVHHRTARRAHKSELQRSEPNGLVTWLAHRTVSSGTPDCLEMATGTNPLGFAVPNPYP
jgi:hypothetical protein